MSKPPQTLFVSYAGVLGGAERILLDRAAGVRGPVALACPEGALATRAREMQIAVVPLRARRAELRSPRHRIATPARLVAQAREVRRLTNELRPKCVVAWSMRGLLVAAGALAALGRSRPPLIFAHNDLLPSAGVGRLVRAAAARADLVVALSQAIAADLDPSGRLAVEVVHPGVDLERFRPSPLPGGPPEALVLGAIVKWKRPDLALEATALARRELPDLRLRLAGSPLDPWGEALRQGLVDRAARPDLAGHVLLEGAQADAPAALRGASCLLHCADREPFGVALAEALACGRPVVAPRAAGPVEIVDESCGILYDPGDAEAAASALVDALGRAPQLAGPARARAERLFDVRRSRRRFAELVDEVVEGG